MPARLTRNHGPLHFLMLEFENKPSAQQKRYNAEDSETTIDEPPGDGDASDMPSDEGQRDNTSAGDQAEGDDPLVTNRVDKRANECNGNDKMSKREPVSAVGKEGIMGVRCTESLVNAFDPRKQAGGLGNRLQ